MYFPFSFLFTLKKIEELMFILKGNFCKSKTLRPVFIKQNVVFLMLCMSDWIGCLFSNFSESDCRITVPDLNPFLLSKL